MGGIEGREPHQAVGSAFRLCIPIGIRSSKLDGGVLDPGFLAFRRIKQVCLQSLPVCPPEVHTGQHLGEILGIHAALAGMDDKDGIGGIMRTAERQLQFQIIDTTSEGGRLGGDLRCQVRVIVHKIDERDQIVDGSTEILPFADAASEIP